LVKQKLKIAILIQARINSTRLPGKLFFSFFGRSILQRVIDICKEISDTRDIYILTGPESRNKHIRIISDKERVKLVYGSEKNVYLRFSNFVKKNKKYKYIIRVTADNYLIQPKILNDLINKINFLKYDYLYVKPLSHYSGELISSKLFLKNKKPSKLAKEHVTWDFRKNKKIKKFYFDKKYLGLDHKNSLTLDTLEDLILLKKIEKDYPKLKKLNNYRFLRMLWKIYV